MFTGPILVFFQTCPQNRSKASKQCPMMIFDHQECSKPPDPGLEADLRISWLEGSISLDFAVRASRNISEMVIQNVTLGTKPFLSHWKPSKEVSAFWIPSVDLQFFHIKLHTASRAKDPIWRRWKGFCKSNQHSEHENGNKNHPIALETFHTLLPRNVFYSRLLVFSH